MNFFEHLFDLRDRKSSLLCVGIDPVAAKMPAFLQGKADGLYTFCAQIIEATAPYAIAFKFNFAFFEALGPDGWQLLARLRETVPGDCLTVADAKRGDIGSTAEQYAVAILDKLAFDGVTLNPYLGYDAAEPFLKYDQKGLFFLCVTSNPGALEVQNFPSPENPLYLQIARLVNSWNSTKNCGLVVGATKAAYFKAVRAVSPDLPILAPGVGAQGATVRETLAALGDTRVLLPVSRGILYAGAGEDFAQAAEAAAKALKEETAAFLGASGG